MSPKFASVKDGPVGDVASLVGERVNGWIRGYPSNATSSSLKDGVIIKGRPVDWVWAIPGTVEYLVVEFSDSHKQYVARGELPELVAPAATMNVPAVTPGSRTTVALAVAVIPEVWTEDRGPGEQDEPLSSEQAEELRDEQEELRDQHEELRDQAEPRDQAELRDEAEKMPGGTEAAIPDLAFLADVARERVYAWIRSYRLSASSCALADGSRVPGRPVGWSWAIPGTVEYLVVEFSDGHKQYLSPADLPEPHSDAAG